MVRVKICGITNLQDALFAVRFGADALGFVFAKSLRQVDLSRAERICKRLPPFVSKAGIFVNEQPERVMEIAFRLHLDILQFHGDETPEYLKTFRPIKTVKAFRIQNEKSLKKIGEYDTADAFLLDSFSRGKAGGTGKAFNWELALEAKKRKKPLILSGGLNPQNVAEAVEKVKPYAVDVSSGVELYPGRKDLKKVRAFIENAKRAS